MKINNLISELQKRNIELSVVNDRLKIKAPEAALEDELFDQIKNHKLKLITHLKSQNIETINNSKLPMTAAQESLWFVSQISDKAKIAYNESLVFNIDGELNIKALNYALNAVLELHPILRTTFDRDTDGNLHQILHKHVKVFLAPSYIDESEIETEIKSKIEKPFNLSEPPLIKFHLYEVAVNRYILLIIQHHIVTDGYSSLILCSEISKQYQHFLNNQHHNALYNDQHLQNRFSFQADDTNNVNISEWKDYLANFSDLRFPLDHPRPKCFTFSGNRCSFEINNELSLGLRNLAKQQKTTVFSILLSVFNILLSKYSQQDDLVIACPFANRAFPRDQNTLGLFANILPLRTKVDRNDTFLALLQQVKSMLLFVHKNQNTPFEKIVSALNIERHLSQNPIAQMCFAYVVDDNKLNLSFPGTRVTRLDNHFNNTSKFDLSLFIFDQKDKMNCFFEFCTDILEDQTIKRLQAHFLKILNEIVCHPEIQISSINMLSEAEKQIILNLDRSETRAEQVQDTIPQIFTKVSKLYGARTALSMDGISLSYAELNQRSNQLAHLIRDRYQTLYGHKLPADTLIGLCVDRSLDTVVGILGILKSGAAYVPLDPNYPKDRIQYILEDSKACLVLTHEQIYEKLPIPSSLQEDQVIIIDSQETKETLRSMSQEDLEIAISVNDLAYVIYTSGSTGKPKGVLTQHANAVSLFKKVQPSFGFNENDVWALFHSFAFDFSVWEIWGALLHGGKLVIVPFMVSRDPNAFFDLLSAEKVTIFSQTPSAFYQISEVALQHNKKLNNLRFIIIGGELLHIENLRGFWGKYGDIKPQLINIYGPTETTVFVTYTFLKYEDLQKGRIGNIGWPIPDSKIYVLDNSKNLCPFGILGEIYIGGPGLAKGYLNRKDLTTDRFVQNPYVLNERLYKTGDLARRLPDGSLQYVGRTDFQIQLRGFRIELGEIEHALSTYPDVTQALVVYKEEGEHQYLSGYYTLRNGIPEPSFNELQRVLAEKLPDYMIPSVFIRLDEFPLTANGKIDQKSLPKPSIQIEKDGYIEPSTQLERQIVEIWSHLLNIPAKEISIDANFFQLGGNSLLAAKMMMRVKDLVKKDLSIAKFMGMPTVSAVANILDDQCLNTNVSFKKLKKQIIADLQLDENIKPLASKNEHIKDPNSILITGATGFLGAHLVSEYIKNKKSTIYCLIRAKSNLEAKERLNKNFSKFNLMELINHERIVCIAGDLSKENFGLSINDYLSLAQNVDAIYHAGAFVHHVYDYEKLREINILSTKEILKLAIRKKNKAVHFISTIGAATLDIHEKLKTDNLKWTYLDMNGYLLTKWVSEQLIKEAFTRGIVAHIYRPGNITGDSRHGYCAPESNHTLLKLKGYIQLGLAYIGETESLDMMPVDLLSKEIISLSLRDQKKCQYNLHNPEIIPWKTYLQKYIEIGYSVRWVEDSYTWTSILQDLDQNNALYPLVESCKQDKDNDQHTMKNLNIHSDFEAVIPDYSNLITNQFQFLIQCKFLPEISINE